MIRIAIATLALLTAAPAQARDVTPLTRHLLAQALVAEAQTHTRDWAAILHVLERRARRAGWPLATMVRRYCAAWRAPHARARRMRRLGPSDARYRRAYAYVTRWAHGRVRDPCRGRAWHWGGAMDTPSGRMQAIDCGGTYNVFYGLVRRAR